MNNFPSLHAAEEQFRQNTTGETAESYYRTMDLIKTMLRWSRSELVATANGTADPEIFWAAVSVVRALDNAEEEDNG